ncbi:hypothetical protein GGR51DRAFT_540954 [Nemania sp. FL0031]|nr:hypothetical protein GGR51DRAFT_540954 [Nemania sp. FL0031]
MYGMYAVGMYLSVLSSVLSVCCMLYAVLSVPLKVTTCLRSRQSYHLRRASDSLECPREYHQMQLIITKPRSVPLG